MLRTYMMFYVCATSICFCSPKGTIMKIRSILTCIMLSLPQYLNCKLLDAYIVFCKVVFYTHLLYLFLLWQINTYLLTYLLTEGSLLHRILLLLLTISSFYTISLHQHNPDAKYNNNVTLLAMFSGNKLQVKFNKNIGFTIPPKTQQSTKLGHSS